MRATDTINLRGGAVTIYLGAKRDERKTAPRRILFTALRDPSLLETDESDW